ncbi:putative major facilitator superfamily transporter [Gordonia rhizosphera NBRC 16068]|uniref:Putative major facilitator superfamily transporter n=2 Tax=Gordonia rhizosphera TaxID=83341 RepID=K6WWI7_9ACTN|nr:putative major facilitator superfamily transporter [Gordonia rhizosphera NBRC 16068]
MQERKVYCSARGRVQLVDLASCGIQLGDCTSGTVEMICPNRLSTMLRPPSVEQGHTLGSAGYRPTTVALFAAGMTTFMALYYVQALLPQLFDHFGISPTTSALAVSLTTGFLAVAIIPASVLSERFGRVRVMVVPAVAASLIGVVLPWSPTVEILLAGRALQGVLCAGVPAVAMAYLAEEVEGRSLGTAMGRYVVGTTIGGLAGRLIPGFAVDVVSWQWALEIACLVSLGFAVVFARTVPSARFFVPQRVSPKVMLRNLLVHLWDPQLRRLFLLGFVLTGGFVTVYNFVGYRLLRPPFGLGEAVVALVFLMYLAGTFSSASAGPVADRVGRWPVLCAGILVMLTGLALTVPDRLPLVLIGMFLFPAGFCAAHSVASARVSARATEHRAEASLYLFHYHMGSSVVGALGGLAFSMFGWVGVAGYVGMLVGVGLLAGFRCGERTRGRNPERLITQSPDGPV